MYLYTYILGKAYAWGFWEVKHWLKWYMPAKTIPSPVWLFCAPAVCKNIFFLFCPFISNRIIVPSRLAKISLHSSPFPLPVLKSPQPQNTIYWDLKCIVEHGRCCHTVSNRSQEHKPIDNRQIFLFTVFISGRILFSLATKTRCCMAPKTQVNSSNQVNSNQVNLLL